MKESKWKRLFQRELGKETQGILQEVNSDPDVQDVEAPDIVYTRIKEQLFQESRLTAEERELIRLGKRYQKKRYRAKYVAVAAAAVFVLAMGITATGAGEKVIDKVQWWIAGRLQTNLDTNDGNIKGQDIVHEDEAYEKIEEVFGVYPVKRSYLPKHMVFTEARIEEELQNARVYYEKGKEKIICINMWFQYRPTSTGLDMEDGVVEQSEIVVQGVHINIIKYDMGVAQTRYRVEFEYQKVYYTALIIGLTDQEVENFVKNLNFF